MKKLISFSVLRIIVNNELPNNQFLYELSSKINADGGNFTDASATYQFQSNMVENNLLWIHSIYGKAKPISPSVYNIETGATENNPRNENQVELKDQILILLDNSLKLCYLFSSNKKTLISKYFSMETGKSIELLNVYNSFDEFVDKLNTIKNVRLFSQRDLTSYQSDLFKAAENILGEGVADQIGISLDMKYISASESLKQKLKNIFNNRHSSDIHKLFCVGKDDNDMEMVFNCDTFRNKIDIEATLDENEMIDEQATKLTLMETIKNEN